MGMEFPDGVTSGVSGVAIVVTTGTTVVIEGSGVAIGVGTPPVSSFIPGLRKNAHAIAPRTRIARATGMNLLISDGTACGALLAARAV